MKTVKLSSRIHYASLEDEQGTLGVMTLVPFSPSGQPMVKSIESREDFVSVFDLFRTLEASGVE